MKPIGKHIVIESIEEKIKTDSGLLLSAADASELRYKRGKVVKPGTEVEVIKEGDEIYYDKRAGFTMIIEDRHLTVILERDVVIVL